MSEVDNNISFTHLHVHTQYSLLYSVASVDKVQFINLWNLI